MGIEFNYTQTEVDGLTSCYVRLAQEMINQIRADAIDDFVKEMGKYWGGMSAMEELETVAKQLKG